MIALLDPCRKIYSLIYLKVKICFKKINKFLTNGVIFFLFRFDEIFRHVHVFYRFHN